MDSDHSPPVAPPSAPPPVEVQVMCPNCGYNLTGAVIGSPCSECGLRIGRGMLASGLPTSGRATASLVLGIISIVTCIFYGIISVPTGLIAISLARGVKQQILREEVAPSSAGVAQAGFVCGIVGLCLGAPLFLLFFGALLVGLLGAMFN